MKTVYFSASLDFLAKYLAYFILALCVVPLCIIYFTFEEAKGNYSILVAAFIVIPIVFIAYLYSPTQYAVSEHSISIIRKAGIFTTDRNAIASVQAVSKKELGIAWRMMGNGGLFGYTGWFSTSLGKMRWFVTQRKNYVMIQTKDMKKYLLSPDDVEGFLAAVKLFSKIC